MGYSRARAGWVIGVLLLSLWSIWLWPTQAQPPCAEVDIAGGFEDTGAWSTAGSDFPPRYVSEPVYEGAQALWMGVPPEAAQRTGYSLAYRVVAVPAGTATVRLQWRLHPVTVAVGDPFIVDLFSLDDTEALIRVWVGQGAQLGEVGRWNAVEATAPVPGETFVLRFALLNDAVDPGTHVVVDAVRLEACRAVQPKTPQAVTPTPTSPSPLPTPTPTSPPTSTPTATSTPTPTATPTFTPTATTPPTPTPSPTSTPTSTPTVPSTATPTATPTATSTPTVTPTPTPTTPGPRPPTPTSTPSLGTIQGTVWRDDNRNGRLELGEIGVGNVTVYLKTLEGSILDVEKTQANGFYQFPRLWEGVYIVEIAVPEGYQASTGTAVFVSLVDGQVWIVNFGLSPTMPPFPTPTPTPTAPPPAPVPPTPTPTATWTPTPWPVGCQETLVQPGFEARGGWIFGPTRLRAVYVGPASQPPPLEGNRAVRLGTTTRQRVRSFSSIRQRFSLPATAEYATLSLMVWTYTEDTDNDRQEIILLDPRGRVRDILWRRKPPSNVQDWERVVIDLTPYLPGEYVLYINVFNDGDEQVTAMWVDEVHVQVCYPTPSPQPTPTPTWTSTFTPTLVPVLRETPTPPGMTSTPTPTRTPTPTAISAPEMGALQTTPESPTATMTPTVTTTPSPSPTPSGGVRGAIAQMRSAVGAWVAEQQRLIAIFLGMTCGLTVVVLLIALGVVRIFGTRQEGTPPPVS